MIITKDNHPSFSLRENLSNEEYDSHLPNLQKLSELPIRDIRFEDHPNLLIFPQDYKTHGGDIGKEKIFELVGDNLITGNIMGFVGYKGTQVCIRSRFADDNGKDYFLHYMLQKVLCLNVFDLDFSSDKESIFDFLIYLFPGMLEQALRQGIYREYQVRRYNDPNIRGRIDIARHIRQNIPYTGKVAYSTREYVSDNHVTQLIRHTIEYIKKHPLGGNILSGDDTITEAVSIINACTPTYNKMERQKVLNQNLRPLSHPYYFAYRDLQRLCVRILRHEEMKYGSNDDQIHGILFDGAWLWEEYLDSFLKPLNLTHPHNRTDKVGLYMFNSPTNSVKMQPDFYRKDVVLDAKYKGHDTLFGDFQREDRFQLLAYMHVFEASKSGLIVPVPSKRNKEHGAINGYGGDMYLFGMPVNTVADKFHEYYQYMSEQETELVKQIKSKLDI